MQCYKFPPLDTQTYLLGQGHRALLGSEPSKNQMDRRMLR